LKQERIMSIEKVLYTAHAKATGGRDGRAWRHQPATLVIWGKYDPSFVVAEAAANHRDLPKAEVRTLDAGHFALYEKPDEIAGLVSDFLRHTLGGRTAVKQSSLTLIPPHGCCPGTRIYAPNSNARARSFTRA
jgi:hypothetical protein